MGGISSSLSGLAHLRSHPQLRCPFCSCCTNPASKSRTQDGVVFLCHRCGAAIPEATYDGPYSSWTGRNIPLKSLHVSPFKETLEAEHRELSAEQIAQEYVRPYLLERNGAIQVGERFQSNEVDFKVIACFPAVGKVDAQTQIFVEDTISCLESINEVTILPVKESIDGEDEVKDIVSEFIEPFFREETRQLVEGEILIYRGVQFKVIESRPKSGIVDDTTTVLTDGDPLPDLERVHILPIYETLPNNEKNITEDQLFETYLKPFFQGAMQYISARCQVNIKGVDFHVVACEPEKGIVSLATVVFAHGGSISADVIRQQQLEADTELARRLQYESDVQQFRGMGPPGVFVMRGSSSQDLMGASLVLRTRLQNLAEQLPENHPQRAMLLIMSQSVANANSPEGFANLINLGRDLSSISELRQRPQGMDASEIARLPVTEYKNDSNKTENEFNSCRICLSDYEQGDQIRTLPCFHRFHQDCIDQWLQRDTKCPICKHPVS